MLLDFLTLVVVVAFIIGVASNSKLILSNQSYINNIFFFTSVLYFYISHYYFSDMLVVSRFAWAISTLLVIALLADVLMLPAMLFLFSKSKIVKPGGEAVNDALSVDLDGQQATDSD